ncbi:MAG TPA: YeaH/YhbH family protein, partial [Burkholderiaceae bacterium]|nr:YeaH/YhbH family protein [Burkholderiaceae bacterium]
PGNKEFVTGDRIPRPEGGGAGGGGSQASDSGESEDTFRFRLTREEFLEFFFEDMELPDLVKTQLSTLAERKLVRAGWRSDGTPSNLSVLRTMRKSLGRRIALSAPYRQRLREIEDEIVMLGGRLDEDPAADAGDGDAAAPSERLARLYAERQSALSKIARVPFIDTFDLRYNNRIVQPRPISQAVMFCLMDVSGSMDEKRKDLAKRFFILLHLFLTRHYERIELVFIRHHTSARVVDEDEFFHSPESGGTLVSSALELALSEIRENYPTAEWNIYVAQASDGDNWDDDSPKCRQLLVNDLLPLVQYFAYVEIEAEHPQKLWEQYDAARATARNLALGRIRTRADVYPVLRELFARKNQKAAA